MPDGYVARKLEEARIKGQRSATIVFDAEDDGSESLPLGRALQMFSVMVTEATGRSVVAFHRDFIATWHVFRHLETISRTNANPKCALSLPDTVTLAKGELAFPFAQGSMTLRGIRLTMDTPTSNLSFKPGQRFLTFVYPCGNGAYGLLFGMKGVFELTPDQHFRINRPDSEIPEFARELRQIGTLDNLRRDVERIKACFQKKCEP
jgi:hypothetical protein